MYAQEALLGQMEQYLRPRESLVAKPVLWVTPPWSLSYPKPGSETQHEFYAGDSQNGVHFWTLKWEERWSVNFHEFWAFDRIGALSVKRVQRAMGGLRHRVETVVLMRFWGGTGEPFMSESRYEGAEVQAGRIRDGILAADRARKSAKAKETAGSSAVCLERLAEMHLLGALSEAEWDRAKDMVIGSVDSARTQALEDLERLFGLFREGAVSEYEFKRKKLELLTW
jgi:hypothetical protein